MFRRKTESKRYKRKAIRENRRGATGRFVSTEHTWWNSFWERIRSTHKWLLFGFWSENRKIAESLYFEWFNSNPKSKIKIKTNLVHRTRLFWQDKVCFTFVSFPRLFKNKINFFNLIFKEMMKQSWIWWEFIRVFLFSHNDVLYIP